MSNGIATRQNEDNSIAMLAAQRQLYREAKKYNTVCSGIIGMDTACISCNSVVPSRKYRVEICIIYIVYS
ncbi:MAG: S-4TM family putative pore-forming effector [Ruminococcus sp.]